MTTKICIICGLGITDDSTKCPRCGYSDQTFKKTIIKSILKNPLISISILLIFFILCALVASNIIQKWERGEKTDTQYLNNLEAKESLLRRITMVHSKWTLIKEKEIEGGQMLVEAQNPDNPKLRPIWLIRKGVAYSINGAATMLTKDFELSYDLAPSEAIDILEGKIVYRIANKTWVTIQKATDVLKENVFITEKEATTVNMFDKYLDDLSNPDSREAVENWAKEHNITVERLYEIQSMRYGHKSIADIEKAGFVKVGEKKKPIKEIGQPTDKLITKFDVNYKKETSVVLIQVQTDLPDGSPLMLSISKTGLKDDDTWIGNESKTIVKNGKAEVTIPLTTHKGYTLEEGFYDIEITFNSYWSTSHKDIDPKVKAMVGEYGENLKTPFTDKYERERKQYRMIKFKKGTAFKVP